MKKLHLFLAVLIVVSLCLAATLWAQEASFYVITTGRIIRTCVSCNDSPCTTSSTYSIYLEVRDTTGSVDNAYSLSCGSGTPADGIVKVTGTANTDDVSLAYDSPSATAYVFYNSNGTVVPCVISSSSPPPPQTYIISGTITEGGSDLSGVTVTLSGAQSGSTTTNSSGYYSFTNLPAGSYTVTPSKANYTFYPLSWSGSLGPDVTAADFTATAGGPGGLPDLALKINSLAGCCKNNTPFTVGFSVVNQGTGDAGPFTVKGYFSRDNAIGGDTLLFTDSFSGGLGAGQTSPGQNYSATFSGFPIHTTNYLILKVDADDQVTESDESNNTWSYGVWLYR
jgi:hypothetical protein